MPVPLHCCDELPTHWVEPGEQVTQLLFKHAGVGAVQVVCVCQMPLESQDWMLLPRHSV